jgi:hypothetical protein
LRSKPVRPSGANRYRNGERRYVRRTPHDEDATAAQCARECVKQGSDFALVSGGKVYTLKGDKAQFDKFAGENVVVKGKVSGTTISVDSITASKS